MSAPRSFSPEDVRWHEEQSDDGEPVAVTATWDDPEGPGTCVRITPPAVGNPLGIAVAEWWKGERIGRERAVEVANGFLNHPYAGEDTVAASENRLRTAVREHNMSRGFPG